MRIPRVAKISFRLYGTPWSGPRSRLRALARAHGLLFEGQWQGADLKALVEQILEAHRVDRPEAIEVVGPPVTLLPKQGLALGLALHELATNAAKYGALSTNAGRVRIAWQLDDRTGQREVPSDLGGAWGTTSPTTCRAGVRHDTDHADFRVRARRLGGTVLCSQWFMLSDDLSTDAIARGGQRDADGQSSRHNGTGRTTFTTAPSAGVDVTADFEFDVPGRFDVDHMAVTIETYRLHHWQQIRVVELRI